MKALRSLSAMRTAVPKRCTGSSPRLIHRRTVRVATSTISATSATVKNFIGSPGFGLLGVIGHRVRFWWNGSFGTRGRRPILIGFSLVVLALTARL